MQQSKAILIGSAVISACILAYLGYTISRDHAVEETARQEQRQQFIDEQEAEYNRLKGRLHDLRLDAYERQFGRVERLRLEAFEYGVRAEGVETACNKQSIPPKRAKPWKRTDNPCLPMGNPHSSNRLPVRLDGSKNRGKIVVVVEIIHLFDSF